MGQPLRESGGCAALLRRWVSAPQCSSLYEERYVLPSQTLNSQGSSPVQETHPLLGEWKVSSPPPVHTAPLWPSLWT